MTPPANLDLTIYQGATFRKRLRWCTPRPSGSGGSPGPRGCRGRPPERDPVDLTGCTARMQVRAERDAADILLELTTENGRIALGDEQGTVDLVVSADDTAAIDWQAGVWDLEIVHPGGDVTRLAEGCVGVSQEVTRG